MVLNARKLKFITVSCNHGLCDSNKLLYKRCAKSMGKPKIRPPTAPTFFNRSFWNSKPRKISRIRPCMQKFGWCGTTGRGSAKTAYFWFFLSLYSLRRVQITP